MATRVDRRGAWEGIGELFVLLLGVVVCILIWRDPRAGAADRAFAVAATAAAAVPFVHRASPRGMLALGFAVIGLGAGASRVGGLGFGVPGLVMCFFAFTAAMEARRSEGRRRPVAITILIVSVLLLVISFFDPGGAAFLGLPVLIPAIVWGARNATA